MSEKAERDKKLIAVQYSELNRLGQNAEYERAIKSANRSKHHPNICLLLFSSHIISISVLGLAPQETLAFHYKIICLIELSKFEEAIQLLNKNATQFGA